MNVHGKKGKDGVADPGRRGRCRTGIACIRTRRGAPGRRCTDHDELMLRTPLCDLLGIDVPIICAPFGPCDEVDLAAAVCSAGALAASEPRCGQFPTCAPGGLASAT